MLLGPWLARRTGVPRRRVIAFFAAAMASHGLVDMATNGGHGIAVLWPIAGDRMFWPVTPLECPPLGVRAFFSEWGLEVLASEARWLWLPALLLGALGLWLRPAPRREVPAGPAHG